MCGCGGGFESECVGGVESECGVGWRVNVG